METSVDLKDESENVLAQYYICAGAISYFILLIPATIRFCIVRRFTEWRSAGGITTLSLFTMLTLFWIITRLLGFIFLFILKRLDKIDDKQLNLYTKLSIAYYEEFFVATYFVYQRATILLKARAYTLPDHDTNMKVFQSAWCLDAEATLAMVGGLTYIGMVVFMTLVYNSYSAFFMALGIWGMFPIIVTMAWMCILSVSYSGKPVLDQQCQKNYDTINKRILFWGIGKLGVGVICIQFSYDDYKNVDFNWQTCVLCLMVLYFSEIFPIFLILDVLIQKSLFIQNTDRHSITQISPLIVDYDDKDSKLSGEDYVNSIDSGGQNTNYMKSYRAIDYKQLKFSENSTNPFPKKKVFSQLGTLCIASFQGMEVKIRQIGSEEKKISNYMFEQVSEEFADYRVNGGDYLEKIIGISKSHVKLCIISEYYQNNQNSYLKSNPSLSFGQKLKIFAKIVTAVERLHNDNLAHGHLTPYNILLDNRLDVYLSDYNFLALRKKMIYNNDYEIKSQYSSPEILNEDKVTKFNAYNDVYSLGIILWELLKNVEPFGNLSIQKIQELVVAQKMRPTLSNTNWNDNIVDLINSCWTDEVNTRPSIKIIRLKIEEQLEDLYD